MCESLIGAHPLGGVDDEQLGDEVLDVGRHVLEQDVGHVVLAAHDLRADLPRFAVVQCRGTGAEINTPYDSGAA